QGITRSTVRRWCVRPLMVKAIGGLSLMPSDTGVMPPQIHPNPVALLPTERVTLDRFSDFWQHAREDFQRPKTGLEPSRVVLYPFAQHSVRHGDPLERYGGRYNAPPLASRHRLQTLGT